MIHGGTTLVCLKREEKNSRVQEPSVLYARAGCSAAHRCHRQHFGTRRAMQHIANICISNVPARGTLQHFTWEWTPVCRKGRAWCAGNQCCCRHGADVMAGGDGRGAAGPAQDVRHPPPGYPNLLPYNTGYPGLSRLIPHRGLSRDIPG